MIKNLGTADRSLRVVAAGLMAACAALAPWSPTVRYGVLGATAVYMLLTALVGTCLGYRLIGKSTCPTRLGA